MARPSAVDRSKSKPLLQVRDLAVTFELEDGRIVNAVNGVHMTIHPGQTLAVVGESGCGKSVSALSILQLVQSPGRIVGGQILLDDRNLLDLSEASMRDVRGREISMIFQEPMTSLNPVYTVGDQIVEAIQMHQRVRHKDAVAIAIESMQAVGMSDAADRIRDFPHQFSGGMQQRVMIAMALACQPRLLLADEPTTALDVTIQAQILKLLRRLQRSRNMAMMLITHDLYVVADTADVVCVMYGGRVVEYARAKTLFATPHHPYTRALINCIPRLHGRRARLSTIDDIVSNPEQFRRLPGFKYGVIPWWPDVTPPKDVRDEPESNRFCLHEVEPDHWIGCWNSEYLRGHPNRSPDIPLETSTGGDS